MKRSAVFAASIALSLSLLGPAAAGRPTCGKGHRAPCPTPSAPAPSRSPSPRPPSPSPAPSLGSAITPDDPRFPDQWALRLSRADVAWASSTGSPAVIIALVDLGADLAQPELVGKLVPGRDVINGDDDPQEGGNGHGTATAGIAAAATNNGREIATYCWGCRAMPVKAFRDDGTTTWAALEAGVRWAADHGAWVISLSWCCGASSGLIDAIRYARGRSIAVVGAGGWTLPEVIATVGVNPDGSNAEARDGDVGVPYCNLTLPMGSGSAYDFCAASSTAPALAGIIGLGLSRCPSASPAQIEQALAASGRTIQGYSARLVDAAGFLAALC